MILPPALTLQSPQNWPIALLALGLVPLVSWLYARTCGSSDQLHWLLSAFRWTALGLAGVAALRPAVRLAVDPPTRPTLIVLVDDSLSMDTVDAGAGLPERVRLAEAIGLIPPGLRTDPVAAHRAGIAELRATLRLVEEAQEEIDYARLLGRDVATLEQRLVPLLDAFARQAAELLEHGASDPRLRRVQERLRSLPKLDPERTDLAARAIEQVEQSLRAVIDDADTALAQRVPEVAAAAALVASSSRLELVRLALRHPEHGVLARLSQRYEVLVRTVSGAAWDDNASTDARTATDLAGALARLRPEIAATGSTVLLLSDGRDASAGTGGPTTIRDLHAVLVGATQPRRDLSLARVVLAETARPGGPLPLRATVRLASPREETLTVSARVGEQQTSQSLRIPANARDASVALLLTMPGQPTDSSNVVVTVEASVAGEDAAADNNRAAFTVRWRPPLRVLMLGKTTRRDVRCLQALLMNDRSFDTSLVATNQARTVEVTDETLQQVETIVLADTNASELGDATWRRIEDAVRRRGLHVVLLVGDPVTLRSYGGASPTRWLLPAEPVEAIGWRTWAGETPRFRAVADERFGDRARVDAAPDESRRRWLSVPRFHRFIAVPQIRDDAEVWLREGDTQAPLLAEWSHGSGRVRWLALSETWRWRDHAPNQPDAQSALFRALLEPCETSADELASLRRQRDAESRRLIERADLSADPTGLARLTDDAATPPITIDRLPSLIDDLLARPLPPPHLKTVVLSSTWPWLGLFVGCVTLEWSLRKRMGLS
jgi:hypothetical protein